MSSEKFEAAQDELEALFGRVSGRLSRSDLILKARKKPGLVSEEARHLLNRSRSELSDAKVLVHTMEREAFDAPSFYRGPMMSKVRQSKELMSRYQIRIQQLTDLQLLPSSAEEGSEVFPGAPSVGLDPVVQAVAEGRAILERTSESLARTRRVATESEEVGEAIISDLGAQREVLQRTRDRLQETDVEITRGRRILARLKLATLENRIFLVLIIFIELAIIGALVYWKWFSKKGDHPPELELALN